MAGLASLDHGSKIAKHARASEKVGDKILLPKSIGTSRTISDCIGYSGH